MLYQRMFDKIIVECFESGDTVTNHVVKDKFIEKYGCRNTPHVNKIALMMRLCDSLDNPLKERRGIRYRKR